ncbi:hypothetical protein [Nevskia ramosa]|uniref:hypothetical protein n=1 Tax=Nevskia ramosa TaxID=64002 RepID=UPI003D1297BE
MEAALQFSRGYAIASPYLCPTGRQHINGLCDLLEATQARLLAAEADDWQPIETVPMDDTPVQVYLESPVLKSRIHTATFRPNMSIIAGGFGFDSPRATHWRRLPGAPQ